MATEVTFSKQGDRYISDSISLESSDIVLHVELKDKISFWKEALLVIIGWSRLIPPETSYFGRMG